MKTSLSILLSSLSLFLAFPARIAASALHSSGSEGPLAGEQIDDVDAYILRERSRLQEATESFSQEEKALGVELKKALERPLGYDRVGIVSAKLVSFLLKGPETPYERIVTGTVLYRGRKRDQFETKAVHSDAEVERGRRRNACASVWFFLFVLSDLPTSFPEAPTLRRSADRPFFPMTTSSKCVCS